MSLVRNSGAKAEREVLGHAQFEVLGDASSQLLMRIFGLLAQQDLLPEHATVHQRDDVLEVRMRTASLSRHRAEVIAEKMRSLVESHRVQFSWSAPRCKVLNPTRRFRFASGLRADRAAIASVLRRRST